MSAEALKFWPRDAAKDPDAVLELHKGELSEVLLIGYDHDGEFVAASSAGIATGPELLWLLELARTRLINGAFMEDEG